MTPDQIVTAELLAGLTKCPFCGNKQTHIRFGEFASYECLSSLHVDQKASRCRSVICEQQENANLRARVKELEEALEPLAKVPIEAFGWEKYPKKAIHGWNDHTITVGDVLKARNLLEKGTK